MSEHLDATVAEAGRATNSAVLMRLMHGRVWRFGQIDVRPARLRRFAALADELTGKSTQEITGVQAVELSAVAEEMLRSALPAADRDAFDTAPFTGTDIAELCQAYFTALGIGPGESAASPTSSSRSRRRSRPTSKRRTGSR